MVNIGTDESGLVGCGGRHSDFLNWRAVSFGLTLLAGSDEAECDQRADDG